MVQTSEVACKKELNLLKCLAGWLEVDLQRFSSIAEKILPVNLHETEDLEIILGINPDMTETETHQKLMEGYKRWNARINSSDSEIHEQAARMLQLIAEAKNNHPA